MEHLSSSMEQQNQQVQWRRDRVQELCSKGYSQREISQILQVGLATEETSYERSFIILNASSALNAFRVLVLTFPADPTLSIRDITVSSLGASIIIMTSYSPKV
jgi:hypothetical protein